MAKAGLRYIRVHGLRRTFASLLTQDGESLAWVKEQMGHHSITITVDIYGHLGHSGSRKTQPQWIGWTNSKVPLSAPQPQLPTCTLF